MSSNEDDYNDADTPGGLGQGSKKRRIQRACDICRRKKIRCKPGSTPPSVLSLTRPQGDGVHMPGNRCSNCITYNFECSYIEAAKKRGPPKGYVESLETRVEKLEKLLRRLCPDETVLQQLNAALEKDNWLFEQPPADPSPLTTQPTVDPYNFPEDPIKTVTTALRRADDATPDNGMADDDESSLLLADNLKRLAIDPEEYRFFGKSSGAMLIQTAIELKNEYTQSDMVLSDLQRPALSRKRADFWTLRPWEREARLRPPPPYEFPEPDLAKTLVDIYFNQVNLYLPLLHQPTFRREVEEGLHLKNESFAATYLLVCAVASRFSDDPRVLVPGIENRHSSGWKWFDQVQMVRKSLISPPSLYDLQFYCLAVQFLQGSSAPQSCWTMVGIGIRLAQDVGAHRRKVHQKTLTAEDELWKRAFWVLVCMDRTVSAALGRPCAIQDEDFDLDFPIECDDEYWDHPDPEQRFKQPPGKPSLMSAFRLLLKLNQVLAFSLRTIYSINKSKILLGLVGQQWEQHIVAELDSALNKWVDSVPDHLRWDPNREDDRFFNQSVILYAAYYHIQILIHRPFIPSPSKPSPLSFPSLAICTNAARSCSHVVDIQRRRNSMPPPQIQMAAFTSGIVLLLSIWGGKRSGLTIDPNKEMTDVHKCMQMLKTSEVRWHSAGRLWDILYELASVGDLPLPQSSPPATLKRDREENSTTTATDSTHSSAPGSGTGTPVETARSIAGSKRLNKDALSASKLAQPRPVEAGPKSAGLTPSSSSATSPVAGSIHPSPQPAEPRPQEYNLPVYSDDLGRLPLHGEITFNLQPLPPGPPVDNSYWQQPTREPSRPGPSMMATPGGGPMQGIQSQYQHYMPPQRPAHPQHNSNFAPAQPMGPMSPSYNMDPATMAAGMMFDTMAASLGYPSPSYNMAMGGGQGPPSDPGGTHGYRMPMAFRSDMADGTQSGQGPNSYPYVNSDMVAMWSNAPSAFELDEWGTYINNVSELAQTSATPGAPSPHPTVGGDSTLPGSLNSRQ